MNKLSPSYQTIIRLFLQILAALGLIGAIAWVIFEPSFEPILVLLASITTFLTSFFFSNAETPSTTPLPDECDFTAEFQIGSLENSVMQIEGSGGVNKPQGDKSEADQSEEDKLRVAEFRNAYQEHFGGRQAELAELDNWLTQTETRLGLLVAPAGMGKSALVANWVKRLEEEQTAVVIYHPISLRYGTNRKQETLYSLLEQMSNMAQKESRSPELRSMAGLDLIDEYLSPEQVEELYLYLGINYDDLSERGKRHRALRLIQSCQRQKRINHLEIACQNIRPDLPWADAFSTFMSEQLDYEPPSRASDVEASDVETLTTQLRINLRKPAKLDKPLLVIVDGLDELEDQLNQPKIRQADFLPHDVGQNVYVLAVARGERRDREEWQDALRWRNTATHPFHLSKLNPSDIEAMVRHKELGLDEAVYPLLVKELYRLSEEGDPLIASLWIGQLTDKSFTTNQNIISFLTEQESSIKGYINGVLDQLAPAMSQSAMPLFEVLSLARGHLSVNDLRALGISVHSKQLDELVGLSGRLITQNDQSAYFLSHSRLRQAIQDEYVREKRIEWFEKFHKYGRCALKQAKQIANPSSNIIPIYILDYYAEHLQDCLFYYNDLLARTDLLPNDRQEIEQKRIACQESLYALVDQTWLNAHDQQFRHYDYFLRDVDYAWEVATANGPDQIALQVKSVLCHAHINSLGNNLPPHLPVLLARDKIWPPLQAIAHMRRISDLRQQTRAFIASLTVKGNEGNTVFEPYQQQELVANALENMEFLWQQRTADEEMFELQLAVFPFLHTQYLQDAVALALKIQRAIHRVRLLAELLPLATQDSKYQLPIVKEIIQACNEIKDSGYDSDTPFIIPTFTILAQNFSLAYFARVFSEIWEADNNIGTKFFDYLAWHIDSNQALAFVEVLFRYEALPEVVEKIGRFAYKLNPQTAYDIAVRLQNEFERAPDSKRRSGGWYVSENRGIGIGLLMLALACQEEIYKQKILQICAHYIHTHGQTDSPYGIEDLNFLYQVADKKLSDTYIAEQVRESKALRQFWKTSILEKDDSQSNELSKYSQELVAYLGIQTLKILFERCTQTDISESAQWWKISSSPYILPSIAQKLSNEDWSFIYEIGNARYDHGANCGYVQATEILTERINHMPEAFKLDAIVWALSLPKGHNLWQKIGALITPERISMIKNRSITSLSYNLPNIAQNLSGKMLEYAIDKFEFSERNVFLQLLSYLPDVNNRKLYLEKVKEDVLQIRDNGELHKTINTLKNNTKNFNQVKMKMLSQPVKTKTKNNYLLSNLQESGPPQILFDGLMALDFSKRDVVTFFYAPISLLGYIINQMQLLYLNKSSHQAIQGYKEKFQKQTATPYFSSLGWWPQRLFYLYYKGVSKLASSRLLWVLYLLGKIALGLVLFPISVAITLLMIPFIVLLIIGFIIFALFDITLEWWRDSFQKKPPISHDKISLQDKWDAVKKQIVILNQFPELNKKEAALITIVYTLGDVLHRGSPDYKKYTQSAENIWAELNSETVADILTTLKHYNPQMDIVESGMEKIFLNNYTAAFSESQTYIRAFIPAIALKNKARLPELIPYIEKPYTQLKAIQYACLAYFLTGQERIDCLQKSVDAFPYAEWPEDIIPYILTWVAEYTDSDLIPHLLGWLQKYPSATALAQLAPKIVDNNTYLKDAFAAAEKIEESVGGFMVNIAPHLDKYWTAKAMILIMQRNIEEEQKECLPSLVDRWLKLPREKEIYEVWTMVLKMMKHYPRHRVLPLLGQFAEVMVKLGGSSQLVSIAQEMITVSAWWNIVWQEPKRQWSDHVKPVH